MSTLLLQFCHFTGVSQERVKVSELNSSLSLSLPPSLPLSHPLFSPTLSLPLSHPLSLSVITVQLTLLATQYVTVALGTTVGCATPAQRGTSVSLLSSAVPSVTVTETLILVILGHVTGTLVDV